MKIRWSWRQFLEIFFKYFSFFLSFPIFASLSNFLSDLSFQLFNEHESPGQKWKKRRKWKRKKKHIICSDSINTLQWIEVLLQFNIMFNIFSVYAIHHEQTANAFECRNELHFEDNNGKSSRKNWREEKINIICYRFTVNNNNKKEKEKSNRIELRFFCLLAYTYQCRCRCRCLIIPLRKIIS